MVVEPWTPKFSQSEIQQAKAMLIQALIKNLDKNGKSTVYNYEIYKKEKPLTQKHLAQKLKQAGDQLEIETDGFIKRIFDLVGWHYVYVENADIETLEKIRERI